MSDAADAKHDEQHECVVSVLGCCRKVGVTDYRVIGERHNPTGRMAPKAATALSCGVQTSRRDAMNRNAANNAVVVRMTEKPNQFVGQN